MNILKLNKVIGVIEVVITLKELQSEEEVVFVLNEKSSIFKFIEKLSINDVDLNRLKIVNEINFNFTALLKDKNNGEVIAETRSLSEVLEYINTDEIHRYMLVLLTDEKDRDVISDIMQQFVYLDLHIDIMLEKEEYERNAVQAFKENFSRIKVSLKVARQGIYEAEVDRRLQGGKNKFINVIDEIESFLQEAENRESTAAVMATKKAGKSVIVNSFLGNDYAPTSFELATPNSIIYKSSSEDRIVLNYRNQTKEFKSVDLLRSYVESIYKNAEEPLGDMYIEYKRETQDLNNFKIIDTPGPNLAGNNHKEIAYKWIEIADVVVFAIDYSKYLTTDEENYLKDIKTFFDKYDKSHALIIIVNKIDLMYTSGVKNSPVRFLDFLQYKLRELGYKGFVIFAASALQYFSAIKVPKLPGCEHLYEVEPEELMSELRRCKAKYAGQKEMSLIRALEDYIKDAEDYQGIKEPSLYKILEKSEMTRVINYTNYITSQKANVELFKAVMRKIDDRFVNIKNNFFAFQISNLSDTKKVKQKEKADLHINIKRLSQLVEVSNIKIKKVLDFNGLSNELETQCNASEYELFETISKPIDAEIASIKESLRNSTNAELRDIFEGSTEIIGGKVKTNFYRILSDMFNKKIGYCQQIINAELDKKEEQLSVIDKKIQEHIIIFNDYLNTSLQANNINITLPKLELAFTRKNFDFRKVDTKVSSEIYDILRKSLYQKHGVIGRLMQIATLNHVDKRFGKYEIDFDSIDEMLDNFTDDIKSEVVCVIKENNRLIFQYVSNYLVEEFQPKIKNETDAMIYNYLELISHIEEAFQVSEVGIKKDIDFIQEKINFLEVARGSLQMFFNLWETVRKQTGDSQKHVENYINKDLKSYKNSPQSIL